MRLALGLVLACASAGAFVVGYAGQHRALTGAAALSLRRPLAGLRQLFSNKIWLVAYGAGIAGWACYVGALALAPLSLVQAVTGATFGPVALLSIRTGRRPGGFERTATVAALVGLLFVLVASHHGGDPDHPSSLLVDALVAGVLAGYALAHVLVPERFRGALLGIGSGVGYGMGDVATKSVVLGDVAVIPAALVGIAFGFVALQLAYQRTSLLASAGFSALFTNAIPILLGVVLFGERTSGAGGPLEVVGFVLVVAGSVVLARV